MNNAYVKSSDRIIALILAIFMFFAVQPTIVYAETVEYPDDYTVTVTDSEGTAIIGATVKISGLSEELTATTDSNGVAKFTTSDIADKMSEDTAKVTITVEKVGYEQFTENDISLDKADLVKNKDITLTELPPQTYYTVTVTDSEGTAIEGATVKISGLSEELTATTDLNGVAKFTTSDIADKMSEDTADVTITVEKVGYEQFTENDISLDKADLVKNKGIELTELPTQTYYTVTVIDSEGTAIEDATVSLSAYAGTINLSPATTDESGIATIDITDILDAMDDCGDTSTQLNVTVSCTDYETYSDTKTFNVNNPTSFTCIVELSELYNVPQGGAGIYTLSNNVVDYDANPHTINFQLLDTTNYKAEYSENNVDYSEDMPTFTEPTYNGYEIAPKTVYVKITPITGSADYKTTIVEATVTIKKAYKDITVNFQNPTPDAIDYGENNNTFTNAVDTSGDIGFAPLRVIYEITDQQRDGEDVNDVATIDDESDDDVTINAAGTITVTATIEGACYFTKSSYTLTINRIAQPTALEFAENHDESNPYELPCGTTYQNLATGGDGEGEIVYSVEQDEEYVEVSADGTVIANNVTPDGVTAKFIATKNADKIYKKQTAEYYIKVVKGEATDFAFEQDVYNVTTGTKYLETKATSQLSDGNITYSIVENSNDEVWDNKVWTHLDQDKDIPVDKRPYYASIVHTGDDAGKIQFNERRYNKQHTFTIKATIAETDNYKSKTVFATVNNINSSAKFTENSYYLNGTKGNDNWYKSDVEIVPKNINEGKIINHDDESGLVEKLIFTDGIYDNIVFQLSGIFEQDKREYSAPFNIPEIKIDQTAPEVVKIQYEPTLVETVLENLTFGYYDSELKVKVSAKDETSGIDKIEYKISEESGWQTITETRENIKSSDYEFTIEPQYKGQVSVRVYDKAGNKTEEIDDTVVVLDSIAPVTKVDFINAPVYKNPTNAIVGTSSLNLTVGASNCYVDYTDTTIEITETNFFASDVKVKLQKRLQGATDYTLSEISFSAEDFIQSTEKEDTHLARMQFADGGDYKIEIEYKDKSGNIAVGFSGYEFTVKKVAPIITIDYDNNNAVNGKYFNQPRTATITIEEDNFVAENVVATVVANKTTGDVPDYTEYLSNPDNWTQIEGTNKYTTQISFDVNGEYSLAINCTDKYGASSSKINAGNASVAVAEFVIDRQSPTGSIKIGEWTQSWTSFPTEQDNRSFTLCNKNAVTVSITAQDSLSGVDYIEYFRTDKIISLEEAKNSDAWTKTQLTNNAFSFVVEPDERFVVYVRVVDYCGNEHFISSDGIILDKTLPETEKLAPIILTSTSQSKELFNQDVYVSVAVSDPIVDGVYSGLKSVSYKVYNKSTSQVTAEGTLFTFDKQTFNEEDLVQYVSSESVNNFGIKLEQIFVDSKTNNSNDIVVELTAIDNAENKTVKECPIKIDTTKPTISVSYDNNTATNGTYFKANRTATITITERNFSPSGVNVSIKNATGAAPTISSWTERKGSGNGDDTVNTATIVYNADGDYTFSISYTDEAGNAAATPSYSNSVAPEAFIIDKTLPIVSVTYDNNSVANGNYYNQMRIATIVITEKNLSIDSSNITTYITASNDGQTMTAPYVSSWSTSGDNHTATVVYRDDGLYTFDISVSDKAGNSAAEFAEQTFYIDQTAPALEITGVEHQSANNGDVIPVITYSDTNYDADNVTISLFGANRNSVELNGFYTDIHNGRVFTFNNFANTKEVDDIYTLTVSLTDKAGNTSQETIMFSVNRFGSTYMFSEATKKLNGSYVKKADKIEITEYNTDALNNIKITLFKNNETKVLTDGLDYKIDVMGGNGQWYYYNYTIHAKNFATDGVYSIIIESDDAAGNISKSDQDTKNAIINFGVDSILPIINIENLESKTTYATESFTVEMSIQDNLKLAKVIAELDDVEYRVWEGEELEEAVEDGGNFSFKIPGDSTDAHKLVVYAVDAAGNGEKVLEKQNSNNSVTIEEFFVTTNLWVRFYTNKPLLYGSIAGTATVSGGSVLLAVLLRRRRLL